MNLKKQSEPSHSIFPFLLFHSYNNEIKGLFLPKSSHMRDPQISFSLFFLVILFLASALQCSSSLSSVAITEISNQTLICALPGQTSLNCTSFPVGLQSPIPYINTSVSAISAITAGDNFLCYLSYPSLNSVTTVGCWSFTENGTDLTSQGIYQGAMLNDFDARNSHICGIVNGSNSLLCWKWPGFSFPNVQNLMEIAVGEDFVCGILATGQIKCFGSNTSIVVGKEPAGNYSFIAAGVQQACAISIDGTTINCWGKAPVMSLNGSFNSLALGNNSGCALRANYTVFCWGEDDFELPESLDGVSFLSITGKRHVFCGVTVQNYSLICWSGENLGSTSLIFQTVMPGPCQTHCQCGMLPDYGQFCSQGYICLPCRRSHHHWPMVYPPAALPDKPETLPLIPVVTGTDISKDAGIAYLTVGCIGTAAFLFVLCFIFYQKWKRKVQRVHHSGQLTTTVQHGSSPMYSLKEKEPASSIRGSSLGPSKLDQRLSQMINTGSGKLEVFSLEELRQVTDNFSQGHRIGCGSFGSVYRATLEDGRDVAIKRAEVMVSTSPLYAGGVKKQDDKDHAFLSELANLSRLNHKNLVQLYGYCDEANERVLVYEFMVNGTLHDHLHTFTESPIRSWATRIKVALDAARGIEYLHTYAVPQIIHRDIKSSNILLNVQWIAKVSDFGLSLMGPDNEEAHISLRAAGTVGYMDPSYYKYQQLCTKSDVYSFGVVLLELLSGLKAIHRNEETGLPRNVVHYMVPYIVRDEIHRVLDPKLPPPTPCEIEAVVYVGYLAADCVVSDGQDRPSMTEIVDSLERALAACLENPFLSRSTTGSSIKDIL
ncbi:serine/threonine-protein kinase-like protein CCR4 [Macadamia integrifolia]|uniref:serine/threonine-protein kinase-like protein CCR4 n=1 Tax=Macadamia integrifolia TaxID=60698 RepID=UPI001C4ED85C|nr:serine/threonine-protein kinase-like protein CCR4 [Macadamia integrifolia]